MPQGRIPDKFTIFEELKEEQSLTFFDFFIQLKIIPITMSACYLYIMKKTY